MQGLEKIRSANPIKRVIVGIGILVAVVLGLIGIGHYYTIDQVIIEGNIHYTQDQIKEMVMSGFLGDNSLYLSLTYQNRDIENIPFIQSMDVEIINHNTIKISVYEKSLAGYVQYLNHYMYFDKDGYIVESSIQTTSTIPLVTGLSFDHIVLYEKLPVENEEIFQQILNVTQLLVKHEVEVDKIYFDSQYNMTLYCDEIKVKVGGNSDLEYKIMQLPGILQEIVGESGTLNLESMTEDTKTISFQKNK